jgi:hypothetical protein
MIATRLAKYGVVWLAWTIADSNAGAQPIADAVASQFPHTAAVQGSVVDQQGRPVAGARITMSGIKGRTLPIDSYAALLEHYSTLTDEQGKYRLTVRFAGEQLQLRRIWVEARGQARIEDARMRQLSRGSELAADYVLQPGEVLAGRLHPLALGLKNATVLNRELLNVIRIQGPGFDQICLTQPNGRFELYVPAGKYTISLAENNVRVEAASGRDDIRLIGQLTPAPAEKLREALETLWSDMDRHYSYFIHKPKVSWSGLRAEFRPRVEACNTREEFIWELIQMLSRLEDMHIWLEVDGETIGTYQKPWQRMWNSEAINKQLAESKTLGDFAQIGTTKEGGYGYLAVFQLKAQPAQVDQLLKELEARREAPGFMVDLRMCSGGSEPIAQRIARWFSGKEVVYAQHAYRNGPQHDDFGPRQSRTLLAAATPYQRPVVCLTGPRTMSSAEAFVLMLKTLPHAATVGAATRGASGNPQPLELPGLNVKVWYSRWVAMDAAGTVFEGLGLAPDVAVDGGVDAHLQDDPTFARALATLRSLIDLRSATLGEIGTPAQPALDPLEQLAQDSDREVRDAVSSALKRIDRK